MSKECVSLPGAVGPYSAAVKASPFVFVSGQLGIKDGKFVGDTIEQQTKQALENLKTVLEVAESSLEKVVKCTVYLKDMNDFSKMNETYATFFTEKPPARAAFEVARLPMDGIVEIECIALI